MVSGLKIGYETLVSDNSGRNAAGDTVIDVVNKKHKVYVTFRHTTNSEMAQLLNAISDYVVNISFLNPHTKALTTITTYTGTPEPEYYTIQPSMTIYKPMNLNFIEL
jgi:threonine dehydrogenase-like Zn-dependent dehydrogenase